MKISFLGDSITLGYALENKEKDRFSALICKELGAQECNFGITGTLVARAGLNKSDGNAYVDRLSLIKDADIATVFGGTNDYFWSDMPINAPSGKDGNDAYFDAAVDKICRYIKENRDVKKTLLITPYKHNGTGNYLGGESWNTSSTHDTSEKNYCGNTIEDYARIIIEYGAKYGIPVLNLYDTDFDYKTMTVDGCHPNPDGHRWLAEKIGTQIKKLI